MILKEESNLSHDSLIPLSPIPVRDGEASGSGSKGKYVAAAYVGGFLALIIVAVAAFYFWRQRRARAMMSPERGLIVDQSATRGVAIPDEPEDTFSNRMDRSPEINLTQGNSDFDGDSDLLDSNSNRISNPILSPPPKWMPAHGNLYEPSVPESSSQVVDLQIRSEAQIEMQDVELQSVNVSADESEREEHGANVQSDGHNGKKGVWDMTPVTFQ